MRPTSVEPVKLMWRTTSLAQALADGNRVVTVSGNHVQNTGRDAGTDSQLSGCQGGQRRQPGWLDDDRAARRQGRSHLAVIMASGKFHGVIAAHTPIGCLITILWVVSG